MGYAVRPYVPKTQRKVGAQPAPGAGNVQGVGGMAAAGGGGRGAAGRAGGRAGGRGGFGGRGGGTPVATNVYLNPRGGVEEDYPLDAHTRNFLDCLKAGNRRTNAPMDIGYTSALPCLLALEAMQQNKVLAWDAGARKSMEV